MNRSEDGNDEAHTTHIDERMVVFGLCGDFGSVPNLTRPSPPVVVVGYVDPIGDAQLLPEASAEEENGSGG